MKRVPVRQPAEVGSRRLFLRDEGRFFRRNGPAVFPCAWLNAGRSVTVVRLGVPCCGGMEHAADEALRKSGRDIPGPVVVLGCGCSELHRVLSCGLWRMFPGEQKNLYFLLDVPGQID